MRAIRSSVGVPLALSFLLTTPAMAGDAHDTAQKILDAQGGAKAWLAAPTISFEHELVFPGQGKPWLSRDVVDRATRRVYQDWPNHASRLVYDGKDVWTTGWNLGNPPKVMPYLTFNTITTPWLLLLPDVVVESTGTDRLPGDDTEYATVTLRLPQKPGPPPVATYYKMYADPKTFELRATAYGMSYGALLDGMGIPPEVEEIGPMIHVFEEWAVVGGLRLPVKYRTIGPDGTVYGRHTVKGWALDKTFDEARMTRPADAVVDTSSHQRAKR